MKYLGHKNWNHWNVSLWLLNDYNEYRNMVDLQSRYGKDRAARIMAHSLVGRKTPDGAPFSYSSIRAAFVGLS
tara:strand:+ start:250 stop:468 length:219 start_codon:yes stop_codon:yes gene_type:complete